MTSILYVEDNEDNIYMLSKRLKKKGFEITIAKDGEEGLKVFNKWSNCLRYQKVALMRPMPSASLVFTLPTLGSLTKIIKCPRFFTVRAFRKFYRFYWEVF